MGFTEQLRHIVESVDGSIACTVMGFDGIPIETVQAPKAAREAAALELEAAWAEYANLLTQVKATAEGLKGGKLLEVLLSAERMTTLVRLLTPEHLVILGLLPGGNTGKGRYALRIAAAKLAAELA